MYYIYIYIYIYIYVCVCVDMGFLPYSSGARWSLNNFTFCAKVANVSVFPIITHLLTHHHPEHAKLILWRSFSNQNINYLNIINVNIAI